MKILENNGLEERNSIAAKLAKQVKTEIRNPDKEIQLIIDELSKDAREINNELLYNTAAQLCHSLLEVKRFAAMAL